ncbi:MAG: hypothetical protein Q9187_004993 [Circinaria calcarea]
MSKEQQQRRWTSDEDAILLGGFQQQVAAPKGKGGTVNWNEIAKKIPGRTNKDCRKRYYNNMTAGLKKGPWTEEEDSRLRSYIEECGLSWAVIAQKIGNRSADHSNLPPDNEYSLMVVDSDLSTPESTDILLLDECRSPDLDSFLDDLSSSDFPDPLGMSGMNDLDDFLNTVFEHPSAELDMQYFPTSSPVAETASGMGGGDFGGQALCHDTNHSSRLHSQMPHSIFSQTYSTDVPYFLVADGKEAALAQAGGVSCQGMAVNGSRLIITIDDAEADTVMGVMKVLVASKAKVNFQST